MWELLNMWKSSNTIPKINRIKGKRHTIISNGSEQKAWVSTDISIDVYAHLQIYVPINMQTWIYTCTPTHKHKWINKKEVRGFRAFHLLLPQNNNKLTVWKQKTRLD